MTRKKKGKKKIKDLPRTVLLITKRISAQISSLISNLGKKKSLPPSTLLLTCLLVCGGGVEISDIDRDTVDIVVIVTENLELLLAFGGF